MSCYRFTAKGHPNILGTHPTTLEFTRNHEVTIQGNCIIGVNSDFDPAIIKDYLGREFLTMIIESSGLQEMIKFTANKNFSDKDELVIRKSNFESSRTLGIYSDKGSNDLNRDLIEKFKKTDCIINITLR